jgi:hypothetical protein
MNVKELIEKLQSLPEEQKTLPAFVQDGCDPSEREEVTDVSYFNGRGYEEHVYLGS